MYIAHIVESLGNYKYYVNITHFLTHIKWAYIGFYLFFKFRPIALMQSRTMAPSQLCLNETELFLMHKEILQSQVKIALKQTSIIVFHE